MKTASFVLEEAQIDWVKEEAKRQGGTTASAIIRRLISDEMDRKIPDPAPKNMTLEGSNARTL